MRQVYVDTSSFVVRDTDITRYNHDNYAQPELKWDFYAGLQYTTN